MKEEEYTLTDAEIREAIAWLKLNATPWDEVVYCEKCETLHGKKCLN